MDGLTKVRRLSVRAVEVMRERDDAIRVAHAEGATLRAIAEVAGLSHGRVHQIVHHRR